MWRNADQRHPCVVCGRAGKCIYNLHTGAVRCHHCFDVILEGVNMPAIEANETTAKMAEAVAATKRSDLMRHAAVHGVSTEAMVAMGCAAVGDELWVPMLDGGIVVGVRTVAMDGSVSCLDGSSIGVHATPADSRPGVMVGVGPLDCLALASAGFSAIGLYDPDRGYRYSAYEIARSHRTSVVVWGMNGLGRYLLNHTPAGLQRLTVCMPPEEFASVHAWVRDGKADRAAILARVEHYRRMWAPDGGMIRS